MDRAQESEPQERPLTERIMHYEGKLLSDHAMTEEIVREIIRLVNTKDIDNILRLAHALRGYIHGINNSTHVEMTSKTKLTRDQVTLMAANQLIDFSQLADLTGTGTVQGAKELKVLMEDIRGNTRQAMPTAYGKYAQFVAQALRSSLIFGDARTVTRPEANQN